MTPEFAVQIMKQALITTLWVSAPLFVVAFVFGAIVNVIQVATSMQDSAFSTVPRLAAFLVTIFVLMPWMLHRMMAYTVSILGDLPRYAK
jgi:flagellar biosynthetic protein FliQ